MKIAIFGKMRSGKDTVGEILIEEHGFTRLAFGDSIGYIIDEYFPKARENGKPRKHYQFIGQALRELDADVWINHLLKRAENISVHNLLYHGKSGDFVVTDGRQENEAYRLREAGYTIVKVVADEGKRIERLEQLGDNFSPEMLQHETERQVDYIAPDILIENNGTLEELRIKVKEALGLE